MVLQQNADIKIWGFANAGQKISVEFANKKIDTKANTNGYWIANLGEMKADATGQKLIVAAGDETITIKDILIGEVWLCSGQSNMDWGINKIAHKDEEIAQGNLPTVRLFYVPRKSNIEVQKNIDSRWQICSSEVLTSIHDGYGGFSAVAYVFGKELHKRLNVPVGLIQSAWGGSAIETWTYPQSFAKFDKLQFISDYINSSLPTSNAYKQKVSGQIEYMKKWIADSEDALKQNKAIANLEAFNPNIEHGSKKYYGLYNAMIAPLTPFAIKGTIWYQGEQNVVEHMMYLEKMKALIAGWREAFENKDMPFYFVQIAPYEYKQSPTCLPELWEAQTAALEIPNTGMVVINDVATTNNIHPPEKRTVGKRLANIAFAKTYNLDDIVCYGPMYKSMKIENDKIRLYFDHVGKGLVSRDGKKLNCFEISAEDEKFFSAIAVIDDGTVVVSSDKVKNPAIVRFAWNNLALPNLMNKDGLPASGFRTNRDNYKLPEGKNIAIGKSYISSDKNSHGWDGGLTDGDWSQNKENCFATDKSDKFPKEVVVNLENIYTINGIIIGTPAFGSTKTVKITLSLDGENYTQVGLVKFPQNIAQKKKLDCNGQNAKFVRLTYTDHYDKKVEYDLRYMFTTELEVYGRKK